MLIIGEDTYVTLDEANQYIKNYYLSSDPLRVQWESTADTDKEILLRKSFSQINELPFTGKPTNAKQSLPFPRGCKFTEQDWQKVKYAQTEQAVGVLDTVAVQEYENRLKLRRAGVLQYTIGDLSEKFQTGLPSESNATYFGLNEKAYKYLKDWLQGGYKVCTSIKPRRGHPWW